MSADLSELYDPHRERLDPAERANAAFAQLRVQLERTYATNAFYRRHWDAAGFDPAAVRSWEDFTQRCPTITKRMLVEDQAEHPPYGSYLGIGHDEIARIHSSSGSSGVPTVYGVGRHDWERAKHVFAMTQWAMGVRPSSVVQFAFPFSLFFGGWGVLRGAEEIGATCFPIGANDTRRHIELMYRVGSTVLEATPSYALHMAEVAAELGYDPKASPLRHLVVGGEAGGAIPATRQKILEAWGAETVCDSGSTSEMFPFCTNTECLHMTGPHLWMDEVWTEVVDREDHGRALPEGERGAVVYTHLWRTSQPMIRFAPGDAAVMTSDPCPCGRTYPRLPEGVLGRLDDMLVLRGVNVYPAAIEQVLRETDGLGLEYRIEVTRRGAMDEACVRAELDEAAAAGGPEVRERLVREVGDALAYACQVRLGFEVVEPGTYERTTMKAKRIVDAR